MLPHQRGQKCCRPHPVNYKHAFLTTSQNPAWICPFCEEKGKNSDSLNLAGICMKQASRGLGTCCFARSCNTASMLPVCGKTTTLPLCPMFGYAPKIYLKWKILHEVLSKLGDTHRCHSWLKGKSKLPRLLGTRDHKTFTLYIGRYHF